MNRGNTGTCELCKHQASKGQMTRHIATCAPKNEVAGAREAIVQVRIDADGDFRYWLHLEARSGSTFEQLDSFLRRIWLECCDHMSAFRVGNSEIPMSAKLGRVLSEKGARFAYEYDFGSTTALVGQLVGAREGCLGRAPLRLLARNNPIDWRCAECSRPATIVCPFCIYEGDGLFCDAHAEAHACAEEEAYLPVVNSPRMGVCGYVG